MSVTASAGAIGVDRGVCSNSAAAGATDRISGALAASMSSADNLLLPVSSLLFSLKKLASV